MIFYHGTSEENWNAIQNEGYLFGRRYIVDNNGKIIEEIRRCTYLAVDQEESECYGNVILKVEYEPKKDSADNNYFDENCWQIRVYVPIPLSNVTRIK